MTAQEQPQRSEREALIDVLCRIEGAVATAGPMKGRIIADSMADALLQGLGEAGYTLCPTHDDAGLDAKEDE